MKGKQAPVALGQRPAPPPDRWDKSEGCSPEIGGLEELEARLLQTLEEALLWARGEVPAGAWDARTPTWPYTQIGLLMVRAISLADAVSDRKERDAG